MLVHDFSEIRAITKPLALNPKSCWRAEKLLIISSSWYRLFPGLKEQVAEVCGLESGNKGEPIVSNPS